MFHYTTELHNGMTVTIAFNAYRDEIFGMEVESMDIIEIAERECPAKVSKWLFSRMSKARKTALEDEIHEYAQTIH